MAKLSLKDKMKRLRPFVTFNHDLRHNLNETLTPREKAEITRYYKKVAGAVTDRHVVYRPKTRENIKKARKYTGQTLPKMKAFAINSPTGRGTVTWRGNEAVIEKDGAFVRTIYPNQKKLACETREYLSELLSNDKYYIVNSKNDWRGGGSKRAIIAKLEAVMERYGWCEIMDGEEPEEGDKEIFTITIVEVDLKPHKTFMEYASQRREAQRDRNAKEKPKRRRSSDKGGRGRKRK